MLLRRGVLTIMILITTIMLDRLKADYETENCYNDTYQVIQITVVS